MNLGNSPELGESGILMPLLFSAEEFSRRPDLKASEKLYRCPVPLLRDLLSPGEFPPDVAKEGTRLSHKTICHQNTLNLVDKIYLTLTSYKEDLGIMKIQ